MQGLFQMDLGNGLFKRFACKNDSISENVHTFNESSRNLLSQPSLAQSVKKLKVAVPSPLPRHKHSFNEVENNTNINVNIFSV